jgi:tetratricopeptide (TPR) repeat protein
MYSFLKLSSNSRFFKNVFQLYLIGYIFCFTSFRANSQDSSGELSFKHLKQSWENENTHDTVRLHALKELIWNYYLYSDPDSAFLLAQIQFDFAKSKGLKASQASAINTQGAVYYLQGEFKKAIQYFNSSFEIYKEQNEFSKCLRLRVILVIFIML